MTPDTTTTEKECEIIATAIFDMLAAADRLGVPMSTQFAAVGSVVTGMIAENYPRSEWLRLVEFFNNATLSAIQRRLNEEDAA